MQSANQRLTSAKLLWIGSSQNDADQLAENIPTQVDIAAVLTLDSALVRLGSDGFDAILVTLDRSAHSNPQFLEQTLNLRRSVPVIVHSPTGNLDDAIHFTRQGAFYVLLGDIDPARLARALDRSVALRCRNSDKGSSDMSWRRFIVGQSLPIHQVCDIIELVASKKCTILISGETGTGKEVIAKAIHAASTRASFPMVSVNCTSLPANLIETELFGHSKGAFTGAHSSRVGRFEQAHRGTIFLDEIGDLPLEAQAKLLRVLQQQEFERVGSSETLRVDVRVIAASNVDLEAASRERKFREDLYYRLNVVPIHMPPLRERREDIPLLLEHFLQKISAAEGIPQKGISDEAVAYLQTLDWPGNVRQLEHSIQMAFALSGDRGLLHRDNFIPRPHLAPVQKSEPERHLLTMPEEGLDFDEVVSSFELSLLNQALVASKGNKAQAAALLRIKRTTLLAKMKSLTERPENCTVKSLPVVTVLSTVLVVEPNSAIRKLIVKTVQEQNFQVLEASSLHTASELFQCWGKDISLVIASLNLPDGKSEALLQEFCEAKDGLSCILLSDQAQVRSPNLRDGRIQRLKCPFSSENLRSLLNEISPASYDLRQQICA